MGILGHVGFYGDPDKNPAFYLCGTADTDPYPNPDLATLIVKIFTSSSVSFVFDT
jgi:hypothetical protein